MILKQINGLTMTQPLTFLQIYDLCENSARAVKTPIIQKLMNQQSIN